MSNQQHASHLTLSSPSVSGFNLNHNSTVLSPHDADDTELSELARKIRALATDSDADDDDVTDIDQDVYSDAHLDRGEYVERKRRSVLLLSCNVDRLRSSIREHIILSRFRLN